MKRITENVLMLLVIILVATFVGMTLTGCSTTESVTGPVRAGDVTNTGCQSLTRGTSIIGNPTLKLTKDGVNLQAEFHDYRVNCAYKDVSVECAAKDGVLDIKVDEVMEGDVYANCLCPVTIYCTIYNANESEYKLKINQEDFGFISFKDHDITEIDLWNHEQAHEEGFDYSLVPTSDALLGRWQYSGFMYDGFGGKIFKEDGTIISWMSMYSGEYSESEWGLWWINEKGEIVVKMGTKEPMPDETYYKIISITDDEMVIREFGGFAGIPFEEGYDIVYKRINLY